MKNGCTSIIKKRKLLRILSELFFQSHYVTTFAYFVIKLILSNLPGVSCPKNKHTKSKTGAQRKGGIRSINQRTFNFNCKNIISSFVVDKILRCMVVTEMTVYCIILKFLELIMQVTFVYTIAIQRVRRRFKYRKSLEKELDECNVVN